VDPFAAVIRQLHDAQVRFVVIGVWGANYYAAGQLFMTQDQDLFLPADEDNLLHAWQALDAAGLTLTANGEPLDLPRDSALAQAVVASRSLTTAHDRGFLQIDLSLVMAGFDFADVWTRHRRFQVDGVEIPVADLADIVNAKRNANREKDRVFLATQSEVLRRLLGG
jgi:hypothetical protein